MPMRRQEYPLDWPAISRAIRERDGNCCAWCGVPNGAVGFRDKRGYFVTVFTPDGRHIYPQPVAVVKLTRIVLTVAHLGAPQPGDPPWRGNPHDKSDVRPENLAALCQACHLGYDRVDHMAHAAATRERKRRERQPVLPGCGL